MFIMAKALTLILGTLIVSDVYGIPNRYKLDGRIVGGTPTTIEEYPYQVSVAYIDIHFCGGSIIYSNHILTAAHCTYDYQYSAENLYVRAGSTILNEGGQVIQVSQIFQHPNYDIKTFNYDISVLRLQSPLSLGDKVQPIPLPSQSAENVEGGLFGTATGWGRLCENGPLPMELQEVQLPTLGTDKCVYDKYVKDTMFCAGYDKGQKDTCQGDSGGPYVYGGFLLGITSWGDGCGKAGRPGVYTKVAYFRDFIDEMVDS